MVVGGDFLGLLRGLLRLSPLSYAVIGCNEWCIRPIDGCTNKMS